MPATVAHAAKAAILLIIYAGLSHTALVPVTLPLLMVTPVELSVLRVAADVAAAYVNLQARYNDTFQLSIDHVISGAVPAQALMQVWARGGGPQSASNTHTSIVGILGPYYSREATSIGAVAGILNLPMISPSATAPMLGSTDMFASFLRTVPSDDLVAHGIVAFLSRIGVKKLAILAEDDEYGLGGLNALLQASTSSTPQLQVTRSETFSFLTAAGLDTAISGIASVDARYVVMWANSRGCLDALLAARRHGLINKDHVWIIASAAQFAGVANVTDFEGVILVEPASGSTVPDGDNVLRTSLMTRWAQLYPSSYPVDAVDTYVGYVFDAVQVFAEGFSIALARNWLPSSTINNSMECFPAANASTAAILATSLRSVLLRGTTGIMSFGTRSNDRSGGSVAISVLQQTVAGHAFVLSTTWSSSAGFGPSSFVITYPGGSVVPPDDEDTLAGKTLVAVAPLSEPFVIKSETGALSGYSLDVMNELGRRLGFAVVFREPYDNFTYTGLVQNVGTGGLYDALTADVTITSLRQQYAEFTTQYFYDSIRLVVRSPVADSASILSFLSPFESRLWYTYVSMSIGCGIMFYLFEKDSNTQLRDAGSNHPGRMLFISIWHTMLGFLARDTVHVATSSGRILSLGVTIASTIVVATYTASVASALTTQALVLPVKGIEDIKSGRVNPFRVGVLPNSAHSAFFTREVSPFFFPMETAYQGFDMLRDGMLDAVINDASSSIYLVGHEYCTLSVLPQDLSKSDFGLVFPKGWQHIKVVNTELLAMRESGFMSTLDERYFSTSGCAAANDADADKSQMGLQGLSGVLVMLAVLLAFAIVVYLAKHSIIYYFTGKGDFANLMQCIRCKCTTNKGLNGQNKPLKQASPTLGRAARASIATSMESIADMVIQDIDALHTGSKDAPIRRKLARKTDAFVAESTRRAMHNANASPDPYSPHTSLPAIVEQGDRDEERISFNPMASMRGNEGLQPVTNKGGPGL